MNPFTYWMIQSLGPRDELTLASGLYSQSDFPFQIRIANPSLRPEKAFHFNVEWTHLFSPRYKLEKAGYSKRRDSPGQGSYDLRLARDFSGRKHAWTTYFELWNGINTPNFLLTDAKTLQWKFVDLNYPFPILFLGISGRW